MGKRCVVAGCSSTHKNDVRLYSFLEDPIKKWEDQVRRTRDK